MKQESALAYLTKSLINRKLFLVYFAKKQKKFKKDFFFFFCSCSDVGVRTQLCCRRKERRWRGPEANFLPVLQFSSLRSSLCQPMCVSVCAFICVHIYTHATEIEGNSKETTFYWWRGTLTGTNHLLFYSIFCGLFICQNHKYCQEDKT